MCWTLNIYELADDIWVQALSICVTADYQNITDDMYVSKCTCLPWSYENNKLNGTTGSSPKSYQIYVSVLPVLALTSAKSKSHQNCQVLVYHSVKSNGSKLIQPFNPYVTSDENNNQKQFVLMPSPSNVTIHSTSCEYRATQTKLFLFVSPITFNIIQKQVYT